MAVDMTWTHFLTWIKRNSEPSWQPELLLEYRTNLPGTGRGLVAKVDFAPGDTIIQVPERFLLTAFPMSGKLGPSGKDDAPYRQESWNHCIEGVKLAGMSEHALLALRLAIESDQIEPLINILPASYDDTMAAKCPKEWKQYLPVSIKEACEKQRHAIAQSYAWIERWIPLIGITKHRFEWAWFTVNTRSVTLFTDKSSPPPHGAPKMALIPFLDMLNHSPAAKVSMGFDPIQRVYRIVTNAPIAKGEEVFICYGPHDNAFLWAEYGFILPPQIRTGYEYVAMDEAFNALRLRGETTDSLTILLALLKEQGYGEDFALSESDEGEIPFRLYHAVRFRVLCASQSPHCQPPQRILIEWRKALHHQGKPSDSSIERSVYHVVLALCTRERNRIDQSLRALASSSSSSFWTDTLRQVLQKQVTILKKTIHTCSISFQSES